MPVSLVFGASGAIGRFLVPRLLDAGHQVIAVSRAPRASTRQNLRWIVGTLPDFVAPPLEIDTIFSLGPLDAFARWFSESRDVRARIVAMGSLSAKTKSQSVDAHERDLAARLVDAERALVAAADARGCASTVLRASLIYGAGLDRSLTPIVRFAQRWRVFPSVIGAHGLRQPVHAEDLAAACAGIAGRPALARRSYDVGGGERLAFDAMLARVRASLAVATMPLPVPFALARAGAGLARHMPSFAAATPAALQRLNQDLVVDHAAAVSDFGWAPRLNKAPIRFDLIVVGAGWVTQA